MNTILNQVASGNTLTQQEAEAAMHLMMRGEAEPVEIAGLLLGLRSRGETLDEFVGFTRIMRQYAIRVDLVDPDTIDLCGTGGDGSGTFNISTTAAFVCAGAGVPVAKHGNRSISSECGSADVLQAAGVRTNLGKQGVEFCLGEVGMAFIFAPNFHPALRHVMPIRRQLGVRTFFNVLGPICNPAGVKRQLTGAFSRDLAQTMGSILVRLGADAVVALHSDDGLDEISLSEPTDAFRYDAADGTVELRSERIQPEMFGLPRQGREGILGGSPLRNADILRAVLAGRKGPAQDVVVLNAAYALSTSGKFDSVADCFEAAVASIETGAAQRVLEHLIEASNQAPTDDCPDDAGQPI